jgi:hypothetical protein
MHKKHGSADTATEVPSDPIEMLKHDHEKVKELFDEFEDAGHSEKEQIARHAIEELKVHAAIEEEIFYPAVREEVEDESIMDEAEEEHHVVHLLIDELEKMDFSERFEAKFRVLAENVKHHIEEEEGAMLPEAVKAGLEMEELGQEMLERRQQVQSGFETPEREQKNGAPARSKQKGKR